MKKIFLMLTVLVSLNAFSTPKMTDYTFCEKPYGTDIVSCVNENFKKGYEIIGVSSYVALNTVNTQIHMAIIEK